MSRVLVAVAFLLGLVVLGLTFGGYTARPMNGDVVVDFAYLAILSLLVVSWLLRLPAGNRMRDALIWVLVIFGLVAAYSLRNDAGGIVARVRSELSPSTPIDGRSEDGSTTVTLARTDDGHFHARALIGEVPVSFLIDTGASVTTLAAEDAERLGIDVVALDYRVPIATANGTGRAAAATLNRFALGGISRPRLGVLIAAPGALDTSLIGMDLLSSLDSFRVEGNRMVLVDR